MEFVSLLGGLYIVLHKSQKFLEKPIVTVHDDIDIFTISTVKPDVVYLSEDWTIRWSVEVPHLVSFPWQAFYWWKIWLIFVDWLSSQDSFLVKSTCDVSPKRVVTCLKQICKKWTEISSKTNKWNKMQSKALPVLWKQLIIPPFGLFGNELALQLFSRWMGSRK